MAAVLEHTTVSVGGLPVSLNVADPEFRAALQERFRGFTQAPAASDCQLDIDLVSTPDRDVDVAVNYVKGRWVITRGDFEAEWDSERRRGWVRQAPNPYSIDTVLRIIHTLVLAEEGGFLLHASSVVRNQHAFLFSGVSGAGKTTISRLAPDDCLLLTDEVSYVRAAKNGYHAFGTPFAGELAKPGEPIEAPVKAVYLLVQGPENRIDAIDSMTTVRTLMRNVLFFAADPVLVNRVFEVVCQFVERVPVARLTFLPTPAVWELIK